MTFLRKRVFLLLTFFWMAIAVSPATSAAPPAPVMRLGDAVRPVSYQLALTLEPEKETFDGRITIDVEITGARDFFWINGQQLNIRNAVVVQGGVASVAQAATSGTEFIGLQFAHPLAAGPARLVIDYSGTFEKNNTRGLFRQQDDGNWYALSQFEATSARRAFPCFDEPHWKTPWTLDLTVRRDTTAVSNMPVMSEEMRDGGMKTVHFETTAPLPSYLIALGVGPFDIVDGGVAGMNGTHLRYITPKGRGAEARYAASVTPRILSLLENYFGRPYPFKKLDSMVIPVTVNFGAMENVGLITYRATLMLAKPGQEDDRFKQSYASVAAHEIAHQWFGDLVTMRWWTDVWLNESFATWMARKTMEQFNPAWDNNGSRERERQTAMLVDRLQSTRQIRQPVDVPDDLGNAFDSITYDKGGAVLGMFEAYLGEAGFREGVRRYLKRHEYGNASAEDFFAAMAESDPRVGKGLASFVSQPGLPRVSATLECNQQPAVRLMQERFVAGRNGPPSAPSALEQAVPAAATSQAGLDAVSEAGSQAGAKAGFKADSQAGAHAVAEQTWTIPVCMRYPTAAGSKQVCSLLDQKSTLVPLPDVQSCPAWLLSNPGGAGYYLSGVTPAALPALAKAPLTSTEQVALSGDIALQVRSAAFPADQALMLAERGADNPDAEVALAAIGVVRAFNTAVLADADRPRFGAWVDRHFSRRALALGWIPIDGESDATRKLRAALLPLAVRIGRQSELRAQAALLAKAWTVDRDSSRLGAMLDPVLGTAAFDGTPELYRALLNVAETSTDRRIRGSAFSALGTFNDNILQRDAFATLLSSRFDMREATNVMQTAASDPFQAQALQTFLQANFEVIATRSPSETIGRLPRYGTLLCSPAERDTFLGFYKNRVSTFAGGPRNLAQTVEAIDLCIASRPAQQAQLSRFFATSR